MTDPRPPFRFDSDHHLRDRLRSARERAVRQAGSGTAAPDPIDARVALGVRRARAWLEAKIAGAAPDESLLVRPVHALEKREAVERPGDARAREIAWRLRRALKG